MREIRPSTRDAIIEAAFELFAEQPTASLGDVADHAGVGRATLHRYFPGRLELMRALAKTALDELETAVEEATGEAESYEDGFRLALEAMVPLANRQWFLAHEGLEADEITAVAYQKSLDDLRNDIESAKREGVFDSSVPTVWIAEAYENLTYAAWSIVRSGDVTPKQAAALAWQTFYNGLSGDRS